MTTPRRAEKYYVHDMLFQSEEDIACCTSDTITYLNNHGRSVINKRQNTHQLIISLTLLAAARRLGHFTRLDCRKSRLAAYAAHIDFIARDIRRNGNGSDTRTRAFHQRHRRRQCDPNASQHSRFVSVISAAIRMSCTRRPSAPPSVAGSPGCGKTPTFKSPKKTAIGNADRNRKPSRIPTRRRQRRSSRKMLSPGNAATHTDSRSLRNASPLGFSRSAPPETHLPLPGKDTAPRSGVPPNSPAQPSISGSGIACPPVDVATQTVLRAKSSIPDNRFCDAFVAQRDSLAAVKCGVGTPSTQASRGQSAGM